MSISGYADADGLSVYYEIHGGDPAATTPFVLLAGGMIAIETGYKGGLLQALAAIRPVVAIEYQGHGHTADREGPVTLERMADDIPSVLDRLGVARAHFVGHSMGGLVSLTIAIRHPARVASLAPVSANRTMEGYLPELVELQRNPEHVPSPELARILPTEEDFNAWKAHYERANPHPERFEAFLGKLNELLNTWPGFTQDQFRGIAAPTLIVQGDDDFVRIEHAAEMKTLIPGARLAVLPGTGHMDSIDRTEWLVPMIEENLSRA